MNNIIIGIADDHPVVAEGLKKILEAHISVQETVIFYSGKELLSFLKDNTIDILFLDITLSDGIGIELCKEVKKKFSDVIVLAFSNQIERSMILQTLQFGASGYLLKNASAEEILDSVYMALKGEIVLSEKVKRIIAQPIGLNVKEIPPLTRREKEILQLLSLGKTTVTISEDLNLSPLTITTHRKNLLHKFNVKNTVELLMVAVQNKLV